MQQRGELLLWTGEIEAGVKTLLSDNENQNELDRLENTATILESVDQLPALAKAIVIWDRLAMGVPQGTPTWHTAKLAAIRLLHRVGMSDVARKRAKYILLSSRINDPSALQAYQDLANQP